MWSKTRTFPAFDALDCFIITIICFTSLFTRLWRLGYPEVIVFDEVYFGNFTNYYVKREFYDDIHPPLGKMVMAGIAYLTQYPGHIDWGKGLGKPYLESESQFISLRVTVNIFSSFCSPLIYAACRCLDLSKPAAAAASALVGLDMTSIVEGRFILSDAILHFFTCLHIHTFCYFMRKNSIARAILSGLTLGAAFSCKFTALGLIAMDGVTQLFWLFTTRPSFRRIVQRASAFLIPCFTVAFASWALHFAILCYVNPDAYHSGRLVRKTLIERSASSIVYWGERVRGSMLKRIYNWNVDTHRGNMRITSPHPWSSEPKYWPLLLDKYVLFYSNGTAFINCLGSPASYWISSAGLALTLLAVPLKLVDWRNLIMCLGWGFSYLPFLAVPRAMYMYHYIVPLLFAAINVVVLLENALGRRLIVQGVVIIAAVACCAYFWPWIIGTQCPTCGKTRLWLRRWNDGPPKPVTLDGAACYNTTVIRATFPM